MEQYYTQNMYLNWSIYFFILELVYQRISHFWLLGLSPAIFYMLV